MRLNDVIRLDPAEATSTKRLTAPARSVRRSRRLMALPRYVRRVVRGTLARAGLRTQLLSIIVVPIVLLFATIAIAGLYDRHEHMAFTQSRVGLLAKVAATRVTDSMNAAAELGQVLRSLYLVDPEASQCAKILRHVEIGALAGIVGINWFDASGNVRCTSKPTKSEANVADRAWFNQAFHLDQQRFVLSGLQISRVFGRPTIALAIPMRVGDPKTDVIAIALDMNWLAELGTGLSADEGGSVLIIDRRDGTVLGASGGTELVRGRRFPGHPLTVKAMSPAPVWSGILPDYEGLSRVFGLAVVEGPTGDYATIAVGLPERAILASADRRLAAGLAIAVLGTVLVSWLVWRLAQGLLLRPIQHLTQRVRSVHLGDLSSRVFDGRNTPREIRLLFESFEAMSGSLQARGDALAASRAELTASEEHHRILAESATDMITRFDANLVRIYVSPACRDVLGYEPEELVGVQPQGIIHPDDVARVNATLNAALLTGAGEARAVYRAFRKDGREIWAETSGRRLPDGAGAVVVTRDVSERKQFEAFLEAANRQLDQLARIDALTGLHNRRAFDEELARQLRQSVDERGGFSLILFDVDWFKAYNDTYGHQAGDDCLKAVAGSARLVLRNHGDFAARYGGEEFAVILPGADEANAAQVAERILAAMIETPMPHRASPVGHVTVSLGIARFNPHEDTPEPETLLSRADAALYQAKHDGRNRFSVAG